MQKALCFLLPLALILALVIALSPTEQATAATATCPPNFSGTGVEAFYNSVGTVPPGTTVTASLTANATDPASVEALYVDGGAIFFGPLAPGATATSSRTFPTGGAYEARIIAISDGGDMSYSVTFSCPKTATGGSGTTEKLPAAPPPAVTDDRINVYDTYESRKAIYARSTNPEPGMNGIFVYDFVDMENTDGKTETRGQLMCYASTAAIQKQPDYPATNTLLGSNTDGTCQIHKLTTGEYQVTIGPEADGLMRVWIWRGIPPIEGSLYRRDYNIYG